LVALAYGLEQFVVPFLPEAADEGFAEVLVERHPALVAFGHGAAAHVPAVVVDGGELAVVVDPDGVEVAGYGFEEVGFAVAAGLLDGAEGGAVVGPGHVGALAVVDQGGAGLGGIVEGGDSLPLYNGPSFGGHVGQHLGQDALEGVDFVVGEGCAIVAFDAALAFALGQVAAESAIGNVVRDYAFFYY